MSPYKDKELLNRAKRTKGFIGFPPGYFIIGLPLDKNSFDKIEREELLRQKRMQNLQKKLFQVGPRKHHYLEQEFFLNLKN